ncbi:MAG: tetratricopeptide repeat protein [Elainellaceae cyanobacterium]
MLDKRKRWLVNIILGIAVLSFAGIALILPLSQIFQNDQQATGSATEAQSSDLAAQARGYELVLEREPDNETALRQLLSIRIQQQDLEATIPLLEKLVELRPEQTEYAVLLAQTKQQAGDREGAAQIYRDVLSSNPGDMNALQGLVVLLLQQERPEAAIGLLEDTLRNADEVNQIQPNSLDVTSVQLLLGRVYVEIGRDAEAIALYDDAIQNDPQDFRPVLSKALILQTQGRNDEADPLFARAESLAPAQYKDEIKRIASGEDPTAGGTTAPELDSDTGEGDPNEAAPAPPDESSSSSPSE